MSDRELLKHLIATASVLAAKRREPVDRVRKKIAFDFILHRLSVKAPGEYTIKGGYAIELKFNIVRATKDLDLISTALLRASTNQNYETIAVHLRQRFIDHLADDVGSFDKNIRFRFDDSTKIVMGGGGGVQLSARMIVGSQRFTEFSIDLSLSDINSPATEMLELKPLVTGALPGIAGVVMANEQIFAEKLHAYMRQSDQFQARTKDFVDLVFLANKDLNKTLAQSPKL